MGIPVDQREAQLVLQEAAEWAKSGREVPQEWTIWTERIDASPSKTFTVALGTALLAKATNPRVDALALKATSGPEAYSARSVGHKVLVPGAITHGYDLRATGREPLNNQPFFRYDRIDEIDRIHARAKAFLPDLISACQEINRLTGSDALGALAAFLCVRIAAARERRTATLGRTSTSFMVLVERTETFVLEKPEGGRRGQAFAGAVCDLVFANVRGSRVNDPSRRFPGDLQILDGTEIVMAVEVRQKTVTHIEAVQFAEALAKFEVSLGLMAMLDPEQSELDPYDLMTDAETLHGVTLVPIYGVQSLFMSASIWAGMPLPAVIAQFPKLMASRLERIEASPEALAEWATLLSPS